MCWQLLEKWMVKYVEIASTYTSCFIIIPFINFLCLLLLDRHFYFDSTRGKKEECDTDSSKQQKHRALLKKIPLKSILMPFEENYEFAATKLKGYSFKSSSFCHISYFKHQNFFVVPWEATVMSVLYKISMKTGLKIEIIWILPWIVAILQ